jgi:hypothetical protein
MSKKYHMREKAFLSSDRDDRDYVIAVVEDAREKHITRGYVDECTDISLCVADWRHEIELHFCIDTVEERENSLNKIRTLVHVINAFRQAVEAEIEVINAREPKPRHERVSSAVH